MINPKEQLLQIAQKLKNNVFSYEEAKKQILAIDHKEYVCCDNIVLTETRCEYPNGLPLTTLNITYCETCDEVHDVNW
jgi:hypothetical protein